MASRRVTGSNGHKAWTMCNSIHVTWHLKLGRRLVDGIARVYNVHTDTVEQ